MFVKKSREIDNFNQLKFFIAGMNIPARIVLIFVALGIKLKTFSQDSSVTNQGNSLFTPIDTTPKVQITIPIDPDDTIPGLFDRLLADQYLILFLVLIVILFIIFSLSATLTKGYDVLARNSESLSDRMDYEEKRKIYSATYYTLRIAIPVTIILYFIYLGVKNTTMQGYVMEWLNLLVRWAHVVAGIMWIGASFYFVFLENNLNRTKHIRPELAGNL